MNKTSEQPVVINRTLTHIADLIRNDAQVQDHLRRTVDFYLINGFLPTLAELKFPKSFARHRASQSINPIGPLPGIDVVGCGYDLLALQSRSCILDTSNFSENEYWTDPYNSSLSYSLPNGFFATNTPESLTMDATIMITSVEDYYRQTTRVDVQQRNYFFFMETTTTQTTEFYRRFYQDYYNLIVRLKQIGWYTLSVSVFPYPKLTPLAQRAFANLPSTFDVKEIGIWKEFFASFGTHLVVSSQMGGQAWAEIWYEKCLTYEHSEIWINQQVSGSFFFIFNWKSDSEGHHLAVDKRFKDYSIYSSQYLGGIESLPADKWKEWLTTVKSHPRPISYRLIPLYELFPLGNQRTALQTAIEYFANQSEVKTRTYVASLESLRGPPPTKCSRNRVRRSLTNSTTRAPLTYADIRRALCPYVGYNGLICEGATGRQAFIPDYRRVSSFILIFSMFVFSFLASSRSGYGL